MKGMEKKQEGKISDALLKVALGYQVAEVTEEFAEVDGELKLTKRKRVKKDIPPDLKAVQLLLSESGEGVSIEKMSDEELEKEKARLVAALAEKMKEKEEKILKKETLKTEKTASGSKSAKTVKKTKEEGQVRGETTKKAVAEEKKPRPKPRKRVVRKTKTEEKK